MAPPSARAAGLQRTRSISWRDSTVPGKRSPIASASGNNDRRGAMLEAAEIGHKISKQDYARDEPKLREALLLAQFDLALAARGPVLVILSGVEGGGRGETANKLTTWMDPRHIRVVAFGERTPEEVAHPPEWRYWRALPPAGKVG